MAIKKVCTTERLLVCKNGKFLRTARKGLCKNEELLYVKGQLLRAVRKLSVNRKLLVCGNGNFLRTAKKGMYKRSFGA